ncbi:MAG: MucR family transcriptional regulator [Kiloniellales bacterium]
MAGHDLMQNTTKVVSSFVANNSVSANDLPVLIRSVADTFRSINAPQPASPGNRKPAVAIRKSVTPEYLVCLEDGKKLKMLKRHLRTAYNLSPSDYRERWGLPADYPMVAPNYAKQRSRLAKKIGLGRR